jgi:hypothetical protein
LAAGKTLGSDAFVEADARSRAETVASLVTALASLPLGRQDKFLLLAAGKKVINELNIRLEPLITFRGNFDALELDRLLLVINVCMDCTFGSILAALLPCLHFQLLPLRQPHLLIKRLQRARTRSSVG